MHNVRPYVLLSCAISIDGFLDDARPARLVLSGPEDLDRVDAVRAGCDAILVGATTIRSDDPRLLVRSERRRAERAARGMPPDPAKVTVTGGGGLEPSARFFTTGAAPKLVYCAAAAATTLRARLHGLATVIPVGAAGTGDGGRVDLAAVLRDLAARGVRRLMVEGGGTILTQFLAAGLADELQLAVAPLFVGDPRAPRLIADGAAPWPADRRLVLTEVTQVGDVALLRYLPPAREA